MKEQDTQTLMQQMGRAARQASAVMAQASASDKNRALRALAAWLRQNVSELEAANQPD